MYSYVVAVTIKIMDYVMTLHGYFIGQELIV